MGSRKLTYEERAGFRSGFEAEFNLELKDLGVSFEYETYKIKYTQPEKARTYTPDFTLVKLDGQPMHLETKGILSLNDRQKHLWIKEQYPEIDIRFVFCNSRNSIRKGSKTTYASWCDANSFQYADRVIPVEWLTEVQYNIEDKDDE